jgi:hypothetical protein
VNWHGVAQMNSWTAPGTPETHAHEGVSLGHESVGVSIGPVSVSINPGIFRHGFPGDTGGRELCQRLCQTPRLLAVDWILKEIGKR